MLKHCSFNGTIRTSTGTGTDRTGAGISNKGTGTDTNSAVTGTDSTSTRKIWLQIYQTNSTAKEKYSTDVSMGNTL